MKLALSESLRKRRIKKRLSQVELAELIASSQSRVAKMEAADSSVSLDLMVKSLLAMGASPKETANSIASAR
jgi:predicted transcriptional regulator